MIGNNSAILNTATVVQALQEYFLRRMGRAPKVVSIKVHDGPAGTFEVGLEGPEEPAGPDILPPPMPGTPRTAAPHPRPGTRRED